jgi:CheY-like chemotaxis protein
MTHPRSTTVLVVDDNGTNRFLATEVLRCLGYRTLEVGSGLEALATLEMEPIDVVVLDIQMPIMNGLEVLRNIRTSTNSKIRRVKVIAATALAMSEDRGRCLSSGADAYLARPFTHRVLLEEIEELLSRDDSSR